MPTPLLPLKPCPCGATVDQSQNPYPTTGGIYKVGCEDEKCTFSAFGRGPVDACMHWNNRGDAAADPSVIDLDQVFLAAVRKAVSEQTWMPAEYVANDWQADVLEFLRHGPSAFLPRESAFLPREDAASGTDTQPVTEPPLIPHRLQLVDFHPDSRHPELKPGAWLSWSNGTWTPTALESEAFVFPSYRLALRFALHFLTHDAYTWMPMSAAGLATSIAPSGITCSVCGCSDGFHGPRELTWHAAGICRECTRPEPLTIWTVYQYPTDHPGHYVARKSVGGIPTHEIVRALTLEGLRLHRPLGLVTLPAQPGDPSVVVECWM